MMARTVPTRDEIPQAYTWDAASVFVSDAAWEGAILAIQERLPQIEAFRGKLAQSPAILADYLATAEQIQQSAGKVNVYATLCYSVNTADATALAKRDRAQALAAQVAAAMAFAEPELLMVGAETLQNWTQQEPRLALYRHAFEQLERRRAHICSAEVETLLRQLAEPFGAAAMTHGILANADLRYTPARDSAGEEYQISQGTIGALLTNPDREVRRTAWHSFADAHLAHRNTMANCIASGVKQNVFAARARGYASALAASLEPNHIPLEVFSNLIEIFKKQLPVWQRYWRVRRKMLGYDQLHEYDIKAPLSKPLHLEYDQAIDWICEGMQPLGEEYVDIMRRGLREQRWVDVYPNVGKRAGAFSTGVQGTHPFIMMSYNDDIFGLSTLAHELGHSMHSYFTRRNQPFVYANYGLFVAEVASNFNQALVRAHLLQRDSDRDYQISIIEEAMSNFHRYFYIMPTLARFELEIHERVERGEALNADSLNNLMADLIGDVYGDEVVLDRERAGSTWAQFSTHMYANFYVYQYATGISGAHALAKGILEGRPGAVDNYLSFLKAGSSLYPLEALKLAGVDMRSPEPVEETFAVLAGLVDRLEALV
jgi:oligoendopeptidase F